MGVKITFRRARDCKPRTTE